MKKTNSLTQFKLSIQDLMVTQPVQAMCGISHHVNISCLDHCIYVSYVSFSICRFWGLDSLSAARGGLLHDLHLYHWQEKKHQGWHLVSHPKAALKNASLICDLTDLEKDIIVKHMWPVTKEKPLYKESFIVNLADKFCALTEMLCIYHLMNMRNKLKI